MESDLHYVPATRNTARYQFGTIGGGGQQATHIRAAAVHEVHDVGVLGDVGVLAQGKPALHRRDVHVDVSRDVDLAVLASFKRKRGDDAQKNAE